MKNREVKSTVGKYQSMLEKSESIRKSIQESYVLSPITLSSQKNIYRGLGMKVRNASYTLRKRIALESKNQTDKGKFCEFIAQMLRLSISENWKRDWAWYAVKDYYEEQMKKKDPSFISDVAKPRRISREYMAQISNIKKMIESFGFITFMKMLYFALNDPKDLYFYNFFNSDFKLWKMNQEDRLRKIKGIMNSKSYWSEQETSIISIEDLANSDELREERKVQAIAQLSPSKMKELSRLENEARVAEVDYSSLCNILYEVEEKLITQKSLKRSYDNSLRYGNTKEDTLLRLSQRIGQDKPIDILQLDIEIESLERKVEDTELKLSELELIQRRLLCFKQENGIFSY